MSLGEPLNVPTEITAAVDILRAAGYVTVAEAAHLGWSLMDLAIAGDRGALTSVYVGAYAAPGEIPRCIALFKRTDVLAADKPHRLTLA